MVDETLTETYVREVSRLVHLQIHGEEVITTSDHPFYVNGCGFLNAGELYVGAKMVIANGEIHQVERMSIEVAKDPQKVYNFQVEDFHTYHVGAEGVLVHNASEEYGGGVSKPQAEINPVDDIIRDGSHIENGKLKPNIKYQTGEHEYIYQTNENGLISHASTDNLQIKTHEGRLKHNSNTYGKRTGDHAGHIFGDRFGGSPQLDNLVSQARSVNLKEYKVIENEWAKALENGKKVTVDIDIVYSGSSTRPTAFNVTYFIDQIEYYKHIIN